MIASVFKKSTPLNYALVVFLMLFFFCIYQFQDPSWMNSFVLMVQKAAVFLVLLASVFLTSFIAKRNGLTKDSTYTALFYFLLLLFSPSLFNNLNLVFANFFILLALRQLMSLQSSKSTKEKIFDASLWIFVASLFHFWCVVFLVLVFISIIFHVASDYRNWILPFAALFVVVILFMVFAFLYEIDVVNYTNQITATHFELDYFDNNSQNASFSIYVSIALFFVFSLLVSMSNRPSNSHIAYKKIIAAFSISVFVFLISANKSNDLLTFTMGPLAIMGAAHIEFAQEELKRNIVIVVFMLCSLCLFVAQL